MKKKQAPLALPLPSTVSPPKRAALPVQSYESKKWLSSLLYALHTLSTPQLASDNSWGVLIVSTGLSHYEATSPSLRANLILPSLPGNSFPPGFNLQGVQVSRRPLEVQTESQGRPGHWFSRIVVQRPAAGICGSSISSEYERCRARMCCLCRCQAATMTSPPTAEWEKSQSKFLASFCILRFETSLVGLGMTTISTHPLAGRRRGWSSGSHLQSSQTLVKLWLAPPTLKAFAMTILMGPYLNIHTHHSH